MSILLYINGNLIDLDKDTVIAQTKQVNDLNSIDNRNSNYTNTFKVPKTANNIKAMGFMTVTGNTSNVPYQRNTCSVYSDSGECFVYNGWAVITDGGNNYQIAVVDGIIDLYKAIENKMMSDLNLSQLKHEKNVDTVIYSWTGAMPYIYILADYNGYTGNVNPGLGQAFVNTDYLVPSVRVEYLWQLIAATFNFDYSGSIFTTDNFKNLFITYPKGVNAIESENVIFQSNDYGYQGVVDITPSTPGQLNRYYAQYDTTIIDNITDTNKIHLNVPEPGFYRLEITGHLRSIYAVQFQTDDFPEADAKMYLVRNSENKNAILAQQYGPDLESNIPSGDPIEINSILNLSESDSIAIVIGPVDLDPGLGRTFYINPAESELIVKLSKVEAAQIDFADVFSDFPIKDFLTEIVQRFGLTMFKDKYSDSYEFLTMREQLLDSETIDWSHKFVRKNSENYIYGSYAQRNWLRYDYNDKEGSYNDGYIPVNNINLEDNKNIIKSKIYSPEKSTVKYLNEQTNVYKIWEKEVTEATNEEPASIEYKPLDGRYYLMRAVENSGSIGVFSTALDQAQTTSGYYKESFNRLSFPEIVQDYYTPIQQILNRSTIVTAELFLNDVDVANIDFKKLYYFKQLSNYYIINKINNYTQGRTTKCELVRVIFNELEVQPKVLTIIKATINNFSVLIRYEMSIQIPFVTFQYSLNQSAWSSSVQSSQFLEANHVFSQAGTWYVRFKVGEEYSDIVQLPIPSNQTIIY